MSKQLDHELTKDNVREYAWLQYKNTQLFNSDEFDDDMRIFLYIKKLLTRHKKGEAQTHQLTLNHIITLNNLFGTEATNKLLKFYIPKEFQAQINSFLRFLCILPPNEYDQPYDKNIETYLRKL